MGLEITLPNVDDNRPYPSPCWTGNAPALAEEQQTFDTFPQWCAAIVAKALDHNEYWLHGCESLVHEAHVGADGNLIALIASHGTDTDDESAAFGKFTAVPDGAVLRLVTPATICDALATLDDPSSALASCLADYAALLRDCAASQTTPEDPTEFDMISAFLLDETIKAAPEY